MLKYVAGKTKVEKVVRLCLCFGIVVAAMIVIQVSSPTLEVEYEVLPSWTDREGVTAPPRLTVAVTVRGQGGFLALATSGLDTRKEGNEPDWLYTRVSVENGTCCVYGFPIPENEALVIASLRDKNGKLLASSSWLVIPAGLESGDTDSLASK